MKGWKCWNDLQEAGIPCNFYSLTCSEGSTATMVEFQLCLLRKTWDYSVKMSQKQISQSGYIRPHILGIEMINLIMISYCKT